MLRLYFFVFSEFQFSTKHRIESANENKSKFWNERKMPTRDILYAQIERKRVDTNDCNAQYRTQIVVLWNNIRCWRRLRWQQQQANKQTKTNWICNIDSSLSLFASNSTADSPFVNLFIYEFCSFFLQRQQLHCFVLCFLEFLLS